MTIRDILNDARKTLEHCDSDTPHLDASLLLAHALGLNREKLYMNLREDVGSVEMTIFDDLLHRRVNGEPVSWITGSREFWGMDFKVGPGVLCPRPDTEILVETTLEFMEKMTPGHLHDCCCGPGPLAVSLAVEHPCWEISASDISDAAGKYFHINNRKLVNGRIKYIQTCLLVGIFNSLDIIVSNPPYLTSGEVLEKRTRGWKEPAEALDGGEGDGLSLVSQLVHQAAYHLKPGGILLLEVSPLQMNTVRKILLGNRFESIGIRKDLGNRDRVIYGYFRGNDELD